MSDMRYKTKIVRSERAAARLIARGWEVVSSTSSGTWVTGRRTSIILRKPKGLIADVQSMIEDEHGIAITGRMRGKGGKR